MEREYSAGGLLRVGGGYFGVALTSVLLVLRIPPLDASATYGSDDSDNTVAVCQPLHSSFCRPHAAYNITFFPNFANKTSPGDAEAEVFQYRPLVHIGCSELLGPLLCAVYFPKCQDFIPVRPCRSSCEAVAQSCGFLLERFGFSWPAALDCGQFPLEVVGGASPTCLKLTRSRDGVSHDDSVDDALATAVTAKDNGTTVTLEEASARAAHVTSDDGRSNGSATLTRNKGNSTSSPSRSPPLNCSTVTALFLAAVAVLSGHLVFDMLKEIKI